METTRLSTREFRVEDTAEGVLLRPVRPAPETTLETRLEDVAGLLKYEDRPKSLREMDEAVARGVRQRHESGRY